MSVIILAAQGCEKEPIIESPVAPDQRDAIQVRYLDPNIDWEEIIYAMEDFTDDLFKGGINDYNQKAQQLNDYLINQYNGTENLAVLLDQYFNLNNSKLNTFINVMSQYEDDFDNPQFIDQLTQQIIIFQGNFNNRNINTRGIFAGLASFFGAGDFVQSVLNVVDT